MIQALSRDFLFFFFFCYERAPALQFATSCYSSAVKLAGKNLFPEERGIREACRRETVSCVRRFWPPSEKRKREKERKKTVVAYNKLSSPPISGMKLYFVPRFAEAAVITRLNFALVAFARLPSSWSRSLSLSRVYENHIEISLIIVCLRRSVMSDACFGVEKFPLTRRLFL